MNLKWRIRTTAMRSIAYMASWLGPRFAARLTARSIRYLPGTSNVTFLVLMRPSFDKDIAALAQHTGLGFVIVDQGFTRFQKIFLPNDRQEQTYYQTAKNTFAGADDPQAIYADELLKQAAACAPINGILSANIDYWQDVGFKYHCANRDLVFGVLCRENAVIPKVVTLNFNRYHDASYRFGGDFVVMAGQTSAQMFRDAKVAPADRILASGLPRYDIWHDAADRLPLVERPFVTLLTFTRGYAADQTFVEVLDRFVRMAHDSKDAALTYLIKTKDADDTLYLQEMIGSRIRANIKIDHSIPMTQALLGSRVIVGYNSLSLIDALISGSQIVLPAWGQCLTEGGMCMYPKTEQSMAFFHYAISPEDLGDAVQHAVSNGAAAGRKMDDGMQAYINRYVTYDPNLLNSSAFAQIALDHVARKQRRTASS